MIWLLIMLAKMLSNDLVLDRMVMAKLARHDLLAFAKLNTHDPFDPLNVRKTRYKNFASSIGMRILT